MSPSILSLPSRIAVAWPAWGSDRRKEMMSEYGPITSWKLSVEPPSIKARLKGDVWCRRLSKAVLMKWLWFRFGITIANTNILKLLFSCDCCSSQRQCKWRLLSKVGCHKIEVKIALTTSLQGYPLSYWESLITLAFSIFMSGITWIEDLSWAAIQQSSELCIFSF